MEKELLEELAELLKKYNATIGYVFSPGADTHGLCDSGMGIEIADKIVWSNPYCSYIHHTDLLLQET